MPTCGRTYPRRPGYRYCPVLATVSMDRPASVPCLPETRGRTAQEVERFYTEEELSIRVMDDDEDV